jgi:hypothetical protein
MEPARLTQFLRGPYDRQSLRDVFEGMTVADISGCCYDEFISAVAAKDRLVAGRLWNTVLLPITYAWTAYLRLEPQRQENARVQQSYQQLVAKHTGCENQNNLPANGPNTAIQR